MANPLRRWLQACSPVRWLENWLQRLEERQRAMGEQMTALKRQADALREQAAELRLQADELRGELEKMNAERAATGMGDPARPAASAGKPSPRCPCGHPLRPNARFCPECGRVFQGRSRPE